MPITNEIQSLSVGELFALFVDLLGELRRRGVVRSTNNPVADFSELLFEKALLLQLAPKSTKGYDATDAQGQKYEIKGRRLTAHNGSRQLSALRGLDQQHFTYLAGVLFREDFSVLRACLVPHEQVLAQSTYRKHTNSWIFQLRDGVWDLPGVMDVTQQLQAVERVHFGLQCTGRSEAALLPSGDCHAGRQESQSGTASQHIGDGNTNPDDLIRKLKSVGKRAFVEHFSVFRDYAANRIRREEAIAALVGSGACNPAGAAIRVSNARLIFNAGKVRDTLAIIQNSNLPPFIVKRAEELSNGLNEGQTDRRPRNSLPRR